MSNGAGSPFDFSLIRNKIEEAQKRTDKELGGVDIPVPGGELPQIPDINDFVKPNNSHGSPFDDMSKSSPGITNKPMPDFLYKKPGESKILCLDIETYKNVELDEKFKSYKLSKLISSVAKDEKKVDAAKKKKDDKSAINPILGKIILIGMIVNERPQMSTNWGMITDNTYYKVLTAFDGSEKAMLEEFWKEFDYYINNGFTLVSFNGKGFDLPYIVFRSLCNGVPFSGNIKPLSLLSKYRHDDHCDLMTVFPKELTGDRYMGLNEMAYLLGLDVPYENDGDKIGGWYENREFQKIIEKNSFDLALTMLTYNKVKVFL